MTKNSVHDIDGLLAELAEVREKGYSRDNEQVSEGIVCFGSCVLNANNNPIAGVAVSVVAEDMGEPQIEMIVNSVKAISLEMSRRMGADISLLES